MATNTFKICPCCKQTWPNQSEFIADANLVLNGYMANFKHLEKGLFLFTHTIENCYSTMAVEIKDFRSLYTGPVYEQRQTKTEDCPLYCLDQEQLDRCEAQCECAYVREISNIIRNKLRLDKLVT